MATRMSRERTCPAALTAKGFALLRSVSLGIFSDVARANRPEVIVTAGQNAAMGKANYGREYSGQLGCRGSEPPVGRCNRRAKCHYCKNIGDSPKGAADADSLEKLFLQAVGNEVRCIGVDATGDVL